MKIPVHISAPSAVHGKGSQPVTFGVPIPRGRIRHPSGVLGDPVSGEAVPIEATVIDRWSDGTARWALIDGVWAGQGAAATLELSERPASHAPTVGRSVRVTPVAGGFDVDTGPATFIFRPGGRLPFDEVVLSDGQGASSAKPGFELTGSDERAVAVAASRVEVEHQGTARTVVAAHATASVAGRNVDVEARVTLFAGRALALVHLTSRNPSAARHPGNFWDLGDPGSILLKDSSILIGPAAAGPLAIAASPERGAPWLDYGEPFELYQDSSGGAAWQSSNHINRNRTVPMTFRGYRLQAGAQTLTGLRATPAVVARWGEHRAAVVVPQFWENCPQAIEVSQAAVRVRLFPAQYADLHELQGGEQKTHETVLAFGADATPELLSWWQERPVVSAHPDWIIQSGAVDFLGPLDDAHRQLVDCAIEGPDSFEQKREVIDEYGWRHFGDIYGDHEAAGHTGATPLVSHYNNQYDPVAGFALQFMRTGDPRWWHAMSDLAQHVVDIDIYHTSDDKAAYSGGLFWHTYHYGDTDTSTHRTYPLRGKGKTFGGGPSADHNYPTGLMLHYFLTGQEASRRAAVGLAEYVIRIDDGRLSPFRWLTQADTGRAIATAPNFYGPSRASGNSLNALVDGHRLTGDARFLAKAESLIRRVVHPSDVIAKNQLDEPEIRWFYAMFLQALGKYLHHRAERGLVDEPYAYGRAALLHYARWMAEFEYPYLDRPEKLEFPTETWAAQDIRKSDIFYFAAMHADGEERARFLERARFFHENSTATLARMPTRTYARPVIVMLTSGFVHGWFGAHGDAVEPRPSGTASFGVPQVFVPQRTIAERRAKQVVVAGGVAALAMLTLLAWHLLA